METVTLKTSSDKDGFVRLEIPTKLINQDIEVVVVMQSMQHEPVDEMGYPIGYFEETYGSFADDLIERDQPAYPEVSDWH